MTVDETRQEPKHGRNRSYSQGKGEKKTGSRKGLFLNSRPFLSGPGKQSDNSAHQFWLILHSRCLKSTGYFSAKLWRRGSDSNRRIEVLQTSPLATWVPRLYHHDENIKEEISVCQTSKDSQLTEELSGSHQKTVVFCVNVQQSEFSEQSAQGKSLVLFALNNMFCIRGETLIRCK